MSRVKKYYQKQASFSLVSIDPALEKAAEDVATVLSGDKATTKAELIAKLKKPLRANKKPQDLVPQKKDKQKKKTTEAKQTDEDRGERRRLPLI